MKMLSTVVIVYVNDIKKKPIVLMFIAHPRDSFQALYIIDFLLQNKNQ
jgi:hypothetical protein